MSQNPAAGSLIGRWATLLFAVEGKSGRKIKVGRAGVVTAEIVSLKMITLRFDDDYAEVHQSQVRLED
jgi:hypothetical protein